MYRRCRSNCNDEEALVQAGFAPVNADLKRAVLSHVVSAALPFAKAEIWLAQYTTENAGPVLADATAHLAECGLKDAVVKRQVEYIAGRQLAALALGRRNLCVPWLARHRNGAAIWPAQTHGSISHTHDLVAVLKGQRAYRLGVDVERLHNPQAVQAILRRTMSERERMALAAHSGGHDPAQVMLIFSAKETVFKALAPEIDGLLEFDAMEFLPPIKQGSVRLRLTVDITSKLSAGTVFSVNYLMLSCYVVTFLTSLADGAAGCTDPSPS